MGLNLMKAQVQCEAHQGHPVSALPPAASCECGVCRRSALEGTSVNSSVNSAALTDLSNRSTVLSDQTTTTDSARCSKACVTAMGHTKRTATAKWLEERKPGS
jgi:hypothetical protein